MLDAAERLVAEGGADALTVDAVIAAAGTSTGAFYARFGDRAGLLAAMQDRFLGRLQAAMLERLRHASASKPLPEAMASLCEVVIGAFTANRNAFVAYMIECRSHPAFRARGAEASIAGSRLVAAVLERHRDEIRGDIGRKADATYRALFALATQEVMFDPAEVTGVALPLAQRMADVASMLTAYLETE